MSRSNWIMSRSNWIVSWHNSIISRHNSTRLRRNFNQSQHRYIAVKFEIGCDIISPNYIATYFEFYRGKIRNRSQHNSTKLCRGKISNLTTTYRLFRYWLKLYRNKIELCHAQCVEFWHKRPIIIVWQHWFRKINANVSYIFLSNMSRFHFVSHGDVIKWKHFPRYWSFGRGIRLSR